jgi:hypothetical protein
LWPKKRATVLKDNLSKLAKSFDTTEDPTLQLKGLSIKRGAEGAIALSCAHGTDFDWEKVSSPHGRTRDEMKAFLRRRRSWRCLGGNYFSFGILRGVCCTTSSGGRPRASIDFWRGHCHAFFCHGAKC